MSGTMTNYSSSNFRVPGGTYIVMDAGTHTYLNVLSFQGAGGSVVCSVGNQLGNDIWNVMPTESRSLTIQSYGTGDFLAVNGTNVVTSAKIYPWALLPSNAYPYAFHIVDVNSGLVLRVANNLNGTAVTLVNSNDADQNQVWFFAAKEPMSN